MRKDRGWTLAHLAELVGMAERSVGQKETGKIGIDGPDRRAFAKAFGMSIEAFDAKWKRASPVPAGIPVINKAPAGQVADYDTDHYDEYNTAWEYIDRGGIEDAAVFAVEVAENSMQPTLYSGDRLVLKPTAVNEELWNPMEADGHVVFVRLMPEAHDGGCFLARFRPQKGGPVVFTKDNATFSPIVVPLEHVARLAVAVERRTKRNL